MYQQVTLSLRVRAGAVALSIVVASAILASLARAADPPLAITEAASGISTTGATLNGKVNPQGAAVANCRFEYGTSTSYGAALPCVPSSLGTGKFNVAVSVDVSALEPGTTYHYRLLAASANGATYGADRSLTTSGAPVCPNADRRLEQGIAAIQLPNCMALEQVSPPVKLGQRAASPTISAEGDRIAFYSLAALADTPGNLDAIQGDPYLADREAMGWVTSPTSPHFPIELGWGDASLVQSFDPALSRWLVLGSTKQQHDIGVAQLFRGGLDGAFDPRSPVLNPVDGPLFPRNVNRASLHGASADHSRAFVTMGEASARYSVTDPIVTGFGADKNVYVAGLDSSQQPTFELMARDKDGKNWGGNCGARLGGVSGDEVVWRNQGAISANGRRAYMSVRAAQPESGPCSEINRLRILVREEVSSGVEISPLIESECNRQAPDPLCSTTDGDDLFMGASVDQSKVYFITNRQLADSDLDGDGFLSGCVGFLVGGCDLYLYDAEQPEGERLIQVSAGEEAPGHPTVGSGAGVSGTVAISGDGSRVYFAATGVLTSNSNPEGRNASDFPASSPKLYTWDIGSKTVKFVGALAAADAGLWDGNGIFFNLAYPVPVTGKDASGAEVGGDGSVLFFISQAQLTAEDADGNFLDAYRYDAEATPPTLECVSCRPGSPDAEPFHVSTHIRPATKPARTGTAFAEAARWASEDGQMAVVQTEESLTEQDLNSRRDDYLWKAGDLSLIPGTTFPEGIASFGQDPPVLSRSGDQIAFTAYSPLLPSDGDTAPDVYVARAGGGFPLPPPQPSCVGEACRPGPAPSPSDQSSATESIRSLGNVRPQAKPRKKAACRKGKRRVIRNGKPRCVKKKKKGSAKHRRANRNKGGQK